MPDQPRRPMTLKDARTEAEATFKKITAKVAKGLPKDNAISRVKQQVTLRIDQDVLQCSGKGPALAGPHQRSLAPAMGT